MRKINRATAASSRPFELGAVPVWQKDAKENLASASQIRQVLLLGNGSLFDDGMIDLLKDQPNLRITHSRYRDDVSIVKDVVRYRPNVVVLILSRFMDPEYIVGRLLSVEAFHLRLVLLSLEKIEIEIYERGDTENEIKSTKINALKVDDFLLAVHPNRDD
jgi:hypothetical protein